MSYNFSRFWMVEVRWCRVFRSFRANTATRTHTYRTPSSYSALCQPTLKHTCSPAVHPHTYYPHEIQAYISWSNCIAQESTQIKLTSSKLNTTQLACCTHTSDTSSIDFRQRLFSYQNPSYCASPPKISSIFFL